MLSGLRAKAVSGNTMYAALKGPRAGYSGVDYYKQLSSRGSFNGIAYNWSWSCQSGTGLPTGSGASPYQLAQTANRSEEHTSELQSLRHLVCRLLLDKK